MKAARVTHQQRQCRNQRERIWQPSDCGCAVGRARPWKCPACENKTILSEFGINFGGGGSGRPRT